MSDAGEGGEEKGLSTKKSISLGAGGEAVGLHKSTPPAVVKIRELVSSVSGATLAQGPLLLFLVSSLPHCLAASLPCLLLSTDTRSSSPQPRPAWRLLLARAFGPAHFALQLPCHGKRGIIDSSSTLRQGPGQSGMPRAMACPCVIISGRSSALAGFGGWVAETEGSISRRRPSGVCDWLELGQPLAS